MTAAPTPAAPPPPPPPAPAPAPPPPAPPRVQVEQTLEHLLQTLLELGICPSSFPSSPCPWSSSLTSPPRTLVRRERRPGNRTRELAPRRSERHSRWSRRQKDVRPLSPSPPPAAVLVLTTASFSRQPQAADDRAARSPSLAQGHGRRRQHPHRGHQVRSLLVLVALLVAPSLTQTPRPQPRRPGQEPAPAHEELHRASLGREHVYQRHPVGRHRASSPSLRASPLLARSSSRRSSSHSQDYRDLLRAQLGDAFPDLADYVAATSAPRPAPSSALVVHEPPAAAVPAALNGTSAEHGTVNGGGDVKMEEVR